MTNPGTLTFSRNTLQSRAILNNPAGSTIDVQNNNQFIYYNGGLAMAFNNAGLLKKSAGTGTSSIGITFTNTGSVDIETGILSVPPYSETATNTLTFVIGGMTPGPQFSRLLVSGGASLTGTSILSLLQATAPTLSINLVSFSLVV